MQCTVSHMTVEKSTYQVHVMVLLLILALEASAALVGGDSSWDTRNYHLYDPFALITGKWKIDIAAAQMQSYFSPATDIPYYFLSRTIASTPLLNILLEIPHAAAVSLAFLLSLRLLRAADLVSRLTAAVGTLIGTTGAATMPYMATAVSDMSGVSLILGGLLVLVPKDRSESLRPIRFFVAAALFGAAVGLKLTFICAAGGLCAAVLVLPAAGPSVILWRFVAIACGGVVGGLITGGWWWAFAWHAWENPVFPLFNNIFHSPLLGTNSFRDDAYLPKSFLAAMMMPFLWGGPFRWAIYFQQAVAESHLRDPRFAIALTAGAVLLARLIRRAPRSDPRIFIVVFFVVSFVIWEIMFSIIRYLSFLELLTGTLIAVCAASFVGTRGGRTVVLLGLVAAFGVIEAITIYPTVPRAAPGSRPLEVTLPAVSSDGMVVLLDGSPVAYLALFEPLSVRFVGANNNLIRPDGASALERQASAAIVGHEGEIWGLETPEDYPGEADRALAFYVLERSSCAWVRSNLVDSGRVRMCRLKRG